LISKVSTKKPQITGAERHKRFVDMAKKVDASEDRESFDKAFNKVISTTTDVRRSSEKPRR
jgi:hypothetical protein